MMCSIRLFKAFFVRIISLARTLFNLFYLLRSKQYKRDFDLWVFGEWFGEKCGDNSACLANYVAESLPEKKCFWICYDNVDTSILDGRIEVVTMGSSLADGLLRKAGVFVIGQSFYDLSPKGFNYFGGAVTLNLWHGVPWKRIGHDSNNRGNFLWRIYNKLYDLANCASYMTSQARVFDDVWRSAFGVPAHNLIHTGLPRNERLFRADFCESARTKLIEFLGVDSNVNIIAYLPTFRDDPADAFSFADPLHQEDIDESLRSTNSIIVEKSHFASVGSGARNRSKSNRLFFLDDWDVQELLGASDILISDYSGAFFDFLILDRPIIHFIYDYERYRHGRGLYFPKESVLAGIEVYKVGDLAEALSRCLHEDAVLAQRRRIVKGEFMVFEHGRSCQAIVGRISHEISKRRLNV